MNKLFNRIRLNGAVHHQHSVPIRQIVYLNLIWLFSYLTITISSIGALFIYKSHYKFIILSYVVSQIILWTVFILVRNNKFDFARRLFLISIYLIICWFNYFFGKYSYTSLFYFAFLPATFNIFSFKRNKIAVIAFIILPLLLTLTAELYGYAVFSKNNWDEVLTNKMRVLNLCVSFLLFALYAAQRIINTDNKQNKYITLSTSLQTTLDNAVGAIWSIDTNHNIVAANKGFTTFVRREFGKESLKTGMSIQQKIADLTIPDFMLNYYQIVLSGKEIFEIFSFNGRDYELKAKPILDENRHIIIGATFTASDITTRLASEKLLIEAKQKAETVTIAKERFLSNMSHELRTPLNGIVGVTNILLDEKFLKEQEKHFETLKNLSEHTLGVINNILDLSKMDAEKADLNNKRFNLKVFLKKLNSIFENTTKLKQINFSIEIIGSDDIFLNGDEIKLSQILINLLGNAIKFTEKGFVKLLIEIKEGSLEDEFYYFRFSVIDSGIGIQKKNLDKIFESFTQADSNTTRKFGGTGLGLTISDKILLMMNSKLFVESEFGKGTTFWFEVKIKKSSFVPKNKTEIQDSNNYSLKNITILLAEDNKVNQMVAKRFLEKWNASVTLADNGKIGYGEAMENNYDVILMDLDMPIMDGYQATYLIKQTKAKVPIIALTAASFEDMHLHLAKKGFADVIQKPFMPEDLYKKIVAVLQTVED